MFQGVVPKECIAQILRVTEVERWGKVYNCCCGTFRFEQMLLAAHPGVEAHSNDVSLYSSAIAGYVLDKPLGFAFTGALAFAEGLYRSPAERLAALLVGFQLGRFTGGKGNLYKSRHYAHVRDNFADYVERTLPQVRRLHDQIPIKSYAACDWIDHIDAAIGEGAAIFAYPPFYKGGYEKMFSFLADNTRWDAPAYRIFDPAGLKDVIDRVASAGVPYCILSDQVYAGRRPALEFISGRGHPHFCYVSTGRSSYRQLVPKAAPFRYRPLDPALLTAQSKLRVIPASAQEMTFLKNVYLAKGINHTPGMANFLVEVDGMLAGGLVYSLAKWGEKRTLYLLSDFATTREARISKLIVRLSLNAGILKVIGRQMIDRYETVKSTAFTDHPVSMKYRGLYTLTKREEKNAPEGRFMLNYAGQAINESFDGAYGWWWEKHGRDQLGSAQDGNAPRRSKKAQAA